jgi:hypothetical protein
VPPWQRKPSHARTGLAAAQKQKSVGLQRVVPGSCRGGVAPGLLQADIQTTAVVGPANADLPTAARLIGSVPDSPRHRMLRLLIVTALFSLSRSSEAGCVSDVAAAAREVADAASEIADAIKDCKHSGNQTACENDINFAVSALASASKYVDLAINDCGGHESAACQQDINATAVSLTVATADVTSAVNDCPGGPAKPIACVEDIIGAGSSIAKVVKSVAAAVKDC